MSKIAEEAKEAAVRQIAKNYAEKVGTAVGHFTVWDEEIQEVGPTQNYWTKRLTEETGEFSELIRTAFAGDDDFINLLWEHFDEKVSMVTLLERTLREKNA